MSLTPAAGLKQAIAEMFMTPLRFLGSIKLAIPLLVGIGVILVGATFYEAEVGSAVVQQSIYKSPWFGGLMFLLAVNLSVSTLLRYPWKGARKLGFALAHWGLVVIIAGSAAVIHLSVEGMLLARTDGGPVGTLRVEGDLLEVASPAGQTEQVSLFIKSDGQVVPDRLGDLQLLGYTSHAIKTVRFENGAAVDNPAVRLALTSKRMGQRLDRWLALAPAAYATMDVGPAELQIAKAASTVDLERLLAEQPANASDPWGYLEFGGDSWQGQVDVRSALDRSAAAGAGHVKVLGFWPDFRLDSDGRPTTASQQLRNPAVQLELSLGDAVERWYVFGNEAFSPVRSQLSDAAPLEVAIRYSLPPAPEAAAFFRVVVAPDGSLHYAAKSSRGFKTGDLVPGQAVTPGWADFEITLAEYLPRGAVKRQMLPQEGLDGEPALEVATPDGERVWVPWGEPTTVPTAAGDWYVAFSPKLLQLPFALKLNDFIVERNEGSESVAMWTSDVTLIDPHLGERSDRRVWMNHPTWFKGWKIAQASWNPGDLAQSTLQVKREPWWVTGLTWLGSVMVTLGVAVMFYGRSVAKRMTALSRLLEPEEKESEATPPEPSTIPILGIFTSR